MRPRVRSFQFDPTNIEHIERHGLDADLVYEVLEGEPHVRRNHPPPGRTGSHLLIGPAADGTMWTIVLTAIDRKAGLWRPITGWPSRLKEVSQWRTRS